MCLALLSPTASSLPAQEKSPAEVSSASDSAPPAKHDYRFEVISIRPGDPTGRISGMPGPSYTPGRFRSESETIPSLAYRAFGRKQGYELESPQWMSMAHFVINATLPEGAGKSDLPIMIRHLLEDRFGLKYHHETRRMSGYELVVVKSGPKLEKSVGPASDSSTVKGLGFEFKDGVPQFAKDAASMEVNFGGSSCASHGHNRTMQALATNLADKLDVPVMDVTGLEGGYDYTLIFTPEPKSTPGTVVSPGGGVPITELPDGPLQHPLLRDALREQLGLELKSVKNVPVDVVVLDSANRVPTEN